MTCICQKNYKGIMLVLLSPAKKLDFDSTIRTTLHSQPQFIDAAATLVKVLQPYSEEDLAALMKLSPTLAALNVERFQNWEPRFDLTNSRQAFLAFAGDVYDKLDRKSTRLNSSHVA